MPSRTHAALAGAKVEPRRRASLLRTPTSQPSDASLDSLTQAPLIEAVDTGLAVGIVQTPDRAYTPPAYRMRMKTLTGQPSDCSLTDLDTYVPETTLHRTGSSATGTAERQTTLSRVLSEQGARPDPLHGGTSETRRKLSVRRLDELNSMLGPQVKHWLCYVHTSERARAAVDTPGRVDRGEWKLRRIEVFGTFVFYRRKNSRSLGAWSRCFVVSLFYRFAPSRPPSPSFNACRS